MGKRKSKKQNKTLRLLLTCLEIALVVAAIVMLVAPAISIKDSDTTFSGAAITFGYSAKSDLGLIKVSAPILNFSFLNLLTYILALVGIILLCLKFIAPKNAKLINLVAFVFLTVSAVFFFLVVPFTSVGDGFTKAYSFFGANVKDSLTLAFGAILSGSFVGVAALLALCEALVISK